MKHAGSYFEVCPNNMKFRRIRSYEWHQVKKESLFRSLSSSLVIAATGFPSSIAEEEVKIFFESKCKNLLGVARDSKEYGVWNLSFNSFDDLLAALPLTLEYQDSKITLVCKRY